MSTIKARLARLETKQNPPNQRRYIVRDGCEPVHWKYLCETGVRTGALDVRDGDIICAHVGNICLKDF